MVKTTIASAILLLCSFSGSAYAQDSYLTEVFVMSWYIDAPPRFYDSHRNRVVTLPVERHDNKFSFSFCTANRETKRISFIGMDSSKHGDPPVYKWAVIGTIENESINKRKTFKIDNDGSFMIETDVLKGEALIFYTESLLEEENIEMYTLHVFNVSGLFTWDQ